MPNKEDSATRHRMVVEEIEIPEKSADSQSVEPQEAAPVEQPKSDILDEGAKVSSQEIIEEQKPIEEKVVRPIQNEPRKTKGDGSPVLWILIPGIFILGGILGGVVFYQKGVGSLDVVESPTPIASTAPVILPTASPSASIDISKFDLAVLNGSGIAGEAGKVKDLLSTANAATYDYTETIIKAKSTVGASVIQKIKDALKKNYLIGDEQTLSSSATTDIQIIVGSSKAE
ncbi:MAG: hypothetical protein UT88_C0024G0002 [Candidatus Woesebacteria bacterium GW2011_GWD2_40_19]|nr:MAG: hypothetical protein UT88_C0024G0002 [Candidatus Woesebacteria bacterium GW2011_GWD2_40_19]